MRISLVDSSEKGFKRWSDAHPARSAPGGAIVAVDQDLDPPMITPIEPPHRPWHVPGVGFAF
jgi:hypothetical protein